MECVYLIRHNETNLLKIGMTTNWHQRSRRLEIGRTTTKIMTVPCQDSGKWEKVLHAMFKHKRLPQSEWFKISEEDAISKMKWLASMTNQKMIVGNWKRAAAGNYYRRRKSSSGNWYTEQKSAYEIKRMYDLAVDTAVRSAEQLQLKQARKEPGFWPVKANPEVVEWQEKDPSLSDWEWLGGAFMILFCGIPVLISLFIGAYIFLPVLLVFAVVILTGKK